MTMIDTGYTGAKVQTWLSVSPREVLKNIIDGDPHIGKEQALLEFKRRIINNDLMVDAIIEYWFTNNYNSLVSIPERKANSTLATKRNAVVQSAATTIRKSIERKAAILLMGMTMPNGKPLGDCTGADCREVGGWLDRVAQLISPDDTVRDKLSEDDLRTLYEG